MIWVFELFFVLWNLKKEIKRKIVDSRKVNLTDVVQEVKHVVFYLFTSSIFELRAYYIFDWATQNVCTEENEWHFHQVTKITIFVNTCIIIGAPNLNEDFRGDDMKSWCAGIRLQCRVRHTGMFWNDFIYYLFVFPLWICWFISWAQL